MKNTSKSSKQTRLKLNYVINIVKEHSIGILVIVLITLITNRNFIFSTGYPAGVDSLPPINLISHLSEKGGSLNIWEDTFVGYVTPITLYHILSLFNVLIDNPALIFKALYILLSLGIGFGMYLYTYQSTENKIASTASSIVFMTNQWILAKFASGQMNHVFAYFLIPILFLAISKCLYRARYASIIFFSFILSIFLLLRIDPIVYIIPLLILYVLTEIFLSDKNSRFKLIESTAKTFILGGLLFIIFASFILVPVLKSGGATHAAISFSLENAENNSLNIFSVMLGHIRQMSYLFWKANTDWNTHQFLTLSQYDLIMLIIPLLAFSSILIKKSDKNTLFFILAAVIFIFLAKGPNPPIGEVYSFLYQNFPLFNKLREPDRWLMNTWFSYAYLVGVTLSFFAEYLKNKLKYTRLNHYQDKLQIVVLIILVPSFLGTWYIFSNGYETWNPPKEEIGIYKWISNQSTDSRVATIPYGFTHMFNHDLGLEADLGMQSSQFSTRSVFAVNSEIKNNANDFYDYTQLLFWQKSTDKIPKILGIYDVRYFTLQAYPINAPSIVFGPVKPTYAQHDFFEKQIGLKKVFEGQTQNYTIKVGTDWFGILAPNLEPPKLQTVEVERSPKVYENEYWVPRIFSPKIELIVIGGTESFRKLAEINSFNFSDWNLIFADHLIQSQSKKALIEQIIRSNHIAFVNSEPLDLSMLLINATWIEVSNYDKNSIGWKEDDWPMVEGFFVYNRDVITSNTEGAKSAYNVEISNNSNYEIWIRAFLQNNAGKLEIFSDGKIIGEVKPQASQKLGFKWLKVGEIELEKGNHKIEIVNENGENKLNGIIIAKKGEVENTLNYVKNLGNEKSIYLLDEEKREKVKDIGNNVIMYKNNRPIGNTDIKADAVGSILHLDIKEISPSKWVAKVNSTAPYTLVFSESYHPMWRAYVNGKEYESILSYYFINSFQINETGEQEVTIEFIGQRFQNIGLIISGLAYLGCFGYLFYDWRRKKEDK